MGCFVTMVNIIDKFDTSLGIILLTENTKNFKVGERIVCDDGCNYTISGIQMGTSPAENNMISLIVN